ncbi:prolyl oligopeptidase family protein [mine drainage metagenome]|uniref:Prolyl oligopeptidase family protein n=2 Tax=mine drainage metagenome TaxID=410659 RepID=T0Z9H1_9ZZZZ
MFILGVVLATVAEARTPGSVLFRPSRVQAIALSPAGRWLAIAGYFNPHQRERLALINLRQPGREVTLHLVRQSKIAHLRWMPSGMLLVSTRLKLAGYRTHFPSGEIWAVRVHGTHIRPARLLVGFRKHQIEFNFSLNRVLSGRTHYPNRIEVERYSFADPAPLAESVNLQTGFIQARVHSPLTNGELLTNRTGRVKLAFGSNALSGQLELWYRIGHSLQWKNLSGLLDRDGPASHARPVGFLPDDHRFYLLRTSRYGTLGLYAVNPSTSSETRLFASRTDDILKTFAAPSGRIYAVWSGITHPHYTFLALQSKEAQWIRLLSPMFRHQTVRILGMTTRQQLVLVCVQGDRNPGDYYLFNPETHTLRYLMSASPSIEPPALSRLHAYRISWRQWKEPVYVAFPHEPSHARGGIIIWIHDHPFRDGIQKSFDPRIQDLTEHGFVVVEVDYPGSFGSGAAWRRAGYRQWSGIMLQGIWAAARWAESHHWAPPGRLALGGTGYGGYAAMILAALHPRRIQAVVSLNGYYNLALLRTHLDRKWRTPAGRRFLNRVLGKHHLRAWSPVTLAHRIRAAVLLIQGERDQQAPPNDLNAVVTALRRSKTPVSTLEEPTQGHRFTGYPALTRIWHTIVQFLNRAFHRDALSRGAVHVD